MFCELHNLENTWIKQSLKLTEAAANYRKLFVFVAEKKTEGNFFQKQAMINQSHDE